MRPSLKNVAVPALSLALVQCDSATGPQLAEFLLAFCPQDFPSFVAIQNEGGAWTPVTLSPSSATLRVSPKFGVAYVHDIEVFETTVIYGTAAELAPLFTGTCEYEFGTKVVNGSVAGVTGGQSAQVRLGTATQYVNGSDGVFQLEDVQDGVVDLVSVRRNSFSGIADRIIVRRGLNQASGSTIPVLNFAAAEAVQLATATLTLTGAGSDYIGYDVEFVTANRTTESFDQSNPGTSPVSLVGVPAALTQSTDRHVISAFASTGTAVRGVHLANRDLVSATVALGPAVNTPTITHTGSPVVWRAQLASQTEYGALVQAEFFQFMPSMSRSMIVAVTAGYLGSTPATWDVQVPNLTGVAGYPSGAALTNTATEWTVIVADASVSTFGSGPAVPDGTLARFAYLASEEASFLRSEGTRTSPRPPRARGFARYLRTRR